jgi:hypothetical protein
MLRRGAAGGRVSRAAVRLGLTPVRSGTPRVRFRLAAGLTGRPKAVLGGDRSPERGLTVRISSRPADARVDRRPAPWCAAAAERGRARNLTTTATFAAPVCFTGDEPDSSGGNRLRERFDVGSGLVALGAVLLLVSLFVDWFDPSGDAWAVFELTDLVLVGCAICGLVAVVPRYSGLARAIPVIAFAALAIVAVQLVDPPPAARGDELDPGAWLALAATAVMAAGATMSAASISVTVDVRGRERRRRSAAIDARETRDAHDEPAPFPAETDEAAADADADARRPRRRAGATAAPPASTDAAPPAEEPRRSRRLLDSDDADAAPTTTPGQPEPDPDRTQALDPVERPKDGS